MNWPSCPSMQCAGSSLSLGNSTILSSCKRSTCAYAGYDKQNVLTNLATVDTCAGNLDQFSLCLCNCIYARVQCLLLGVFNRPGIHFKLLSCLVLVGFCKGWVKNELGQKTSFTIKKIKRAIKGLNKHRKQASMNRILEG